MDPAEMESNSSTDVEKANKGEQTAVHNEQSMAQTTRMLGKILLGESFLKIILVLIDKRSIRSIREGTELRSTRSSRVVAHMRRLRSANKGLLLAGERHSHPECVLVDLSVCSHGQILELMVMRRHGVVWLEGLEMGFHDRNRAVAGGHEGVDLVVDEKNGC
ncbi:hypothetical protein HG530_013768 [Fusarium avenaceum]|nr:hypothetical protein HG530_013768 [Fusarium avenaceum]